MPTTFPRYRRAGNKTPARSYDDTSQPFFHIGSQCHVERKLCPLWPASSSIGVPLRCGCAVFQAAASGGSVAPQFPGNRRRRPTEAAPNLSNGAPHPHSPCLPRSLPRTLAAHLGLRSAVGPATTTAAVQIDPSVAFECTSQSP